MQEEFYPFTISYHEIHYQFVSVSEIKEVDKLVILNQTSNDLIYNLALLDVSTDGEKSDTSYSKNGDLEKILATVFNIIEDFLNRFKDSVIVFRGSDARRQRLYRIVITKELKTIGERFVILGIHENVVSPFKSDIPYDFYVIKKKI